jgi:PUA domain protein
MSCQHARLTRYPRLLDCRFSKEDNIKTHAPVRSSEQRQIRANLVQQYPALEEYIEELFPKKEPLVVCKCKDYIQMLVSPAGELLFFQVRAVACCIGTAHIASRCTHFRTPPVPHSNSISSRRPRLPPCAQCRSGPYIPTLKLLHRFPDILPKYQVDRGAIRFVLSGANIMAPGLTSPGGKMDDVPADSVVAIMAEGKEHALAIGITLKSTQQIRETNKDIAVENTHWLKDGLWSMPRIE